MPSSASACDEPEYLQPRPWELCNQSIPWLARHPVVFPHDGTTRLKAVRRAVLPVSYS